MLKFARSLMEFEKKIDSIFSYKKIKKFITQLSSPSHSSSSSPFSSKIFREALICFRVAALLATPEKPRLLYTYIHGTRILSSNFTTRPLDSKFFPALGIQSFATFVCSQTLTLLSRFAAFPFTTLTLLAHAIHRLACSVHGLAHSVRSRNSP